MSEKAQILIVEDDLDLAEMLNAYFRVQGYEVLTANWGKDAVKMSGEHIPDLIVLDIRLPDIDGFEVCRQIRANRKTASAPVIFLTEKRDRVDKLAGLELGVVDYITKPFDIQELRLRVRNALQRSTLSPLVHPVTNIAEGSLTDDKLSELIHHADPWSILLMRIKGLDHFRETYGFVASDDVLRAVGLMMSNAVKDVGNEGDFIGHLDTTDFVVVTSPDKVQAFQDRLKSRLQQSIEFFYPLKDREKIKELTKDQKLRLTMGVTKKGESETKDVDALKQLILKAEEKDVE